MVKIKGSRGLDSSNSTTRQLDEPVSDQAVSTEVDATMDRVDFSLTGVEFREFKALLDSAPEPNQFLRRLVRQRPPWDRER